MGGGWWVAGDTWLLGAGKAWIKEPLVEARHGVLSSATCIHLCLPPRCALSPPPAAFSLQYWKRMRAPNAQFGGVDGSGCAFLQTAAEKLDVPDNSQDIVYCVYLFHE